MVSFPTYGMAGIGIAAAIGFVFALSFLVNKGGVVDDGGSAFQANEPALDQQRTAAPDTEPFAKDAGESAPAGAEFTSTMAVAAPPVLSSVTALDANRDLRREVVSGMEFKVGDPVIIRASVTNPGELVAPDHFIALNIRPAGAGDTLTSDNRPAENAAILQGNIAANSTVNLELYWTPQVAGEYNVLVFSATPDELASPEPIVPAFSVPVKVSQ